MAKKQDVKNTQQEALAKELRGLIPKLDSEGLAFLVEQARIHLYNMQVVELDRAAQEADAASLRAGKLASSKHAASKAKGAGKAGAKGSTKSAGEKIRIEGTESGSSYYLYYGNNEVMFSKSEMVHLVKVANGAGTDLEIRTRLFAWFERERTDVFAVVPISGKTDPHLKTLAEVLRNTFKLRKG